MVTFPALPGSNTNDDAVSTNQNLGFGIQLGSFSTTTVGVSTNGFINFSGAQSGCCSGQPLNNQTVANPIIAALWTDLYPANGSLTFGQSTLGGRNVFVAQWNGTPYCCGVAPLSYFQVVIIDRSDRRAGDFDVQLNYNSVAAAARTITIGVSEGSGNPSNTKTVPGSGLTANELGDGGINALTAGSNVNVLGRYLFQIINGIVYFGVQSSPLLTTLLPGEAPKSASSLATAIDAFVGRGGTLPAGFNTLYDLTGSTLTQALQQIAGEATAGGGQQGGTQLTNSFMTLLLNGFVGGRGATGGFGAAFGYAPAPAISPEAADAYGAINQAIGLSSRPDTTWTAWGSVYGGQANARGDAQAGTSDTRATTWGLAAGYDRRISPSTVVGLAFAGGSTGWSLANGGGGGRGEVFQAGVYSSHQIGNAYVSAAASYAYHSINTDRTLTIAGTDKLAAHFNAHNVGGRIETGRRFAGLGPVAVTPYAAAQVQAFFQPSYGESATSGSNQFALAFNSHTSITTRGELGFWFDTRQIASNNTVTLFGRLAWAHDWRSDDSVTASFQSLSGSSFVVNGATPPKDLGLVTAGIEAKATKAMTVVAKFDGEFALRYQSYAGTGTVRYAW